MKCLLLQKVSNQSVTYQLPQTIT